MILRSIFALLIVFGMLTSDAFAQSTSTLKAQELYDTCIEDVKSADFKETKCSFYIQGAIEGLGIGIYMVLGHISSLEEYEREFEGKFCWDFSSHSAKEIAELFVRWADIRQPKGLNETAVLGLLEMMADKDFCRKLSR